MSTPVDVEGVFRTWMRRVDAQVGDLVGVSVHDLADFNSRDAFDGGMTPREAAIEALSNDDTFSAWVAELEDAGEF